MATEEFFSIRKVGVRETGVLISTVEEHIGRRYEKDLRRILVKQEGIIGRVSDVLLDRNTQSGHGASKEGTQKGI
jgi:hypothetical protein